MRPWFYLVLSGLALLALAAGILYRQAGVTPLSPQRLASAVPARALIVVRKSAIVTTRPKVVRALPRSKTSLH